MTTFCRITGHARNLPKPCYFPLLPPITPAEAKKLCKITGKASDIHKYSPIIAFGKPINFDGIEGCKITKHESLIFVRPVFEKTKDNEKCYLHLEEVLKKMKFQLLKRPEAEREFVYHLPEQRMNLVVPPEMEEAIRTGELESVSMSKDTKFVNVKIKQGRIVKMDLRTLKFSEIEEREDLYYGEGQSKEVLEEQQKVLNERNKRKANTMARKKRFEALDAKAEAEELRDTVKPVYNKPRVKFNAKQRAEKLAKMEAMLREQAENKAILLPKVDTKKLQDEQLQYERMLADIMQAQVSSIKLTVVSSGFDWHAAEAAESSGFDWESFPHEEWIDPVEVVETVVAKEDLVMREDVANLEIVASVEIVRPALPMPQEVAKMVCTMKKRSLKKTENVGDALSAVTDPSIIPTFEDITKIAANIEAAELGYLVKKPEGAEFVAKLDYVESGDVAVSGAMVEVDEAKKFVAGQIIKLADQESFVSGQTVDTPLGKKFVPGQTIINRNGDINFVPGQCVKSLDEKIEFVAGQVFHTPNGPKFVAGQVMDRGDGKSVFVAGQTVTTEDGPKFCPGEVTVDAYGEDVFVPGLIMPTASGEKFVSGQTFQSEEGITFKPGQIMDTIEGPTFVPGKTFDTPEGKKFIKGDLVEDDEGNVKFEHRPFEEKDIREWLLIPNKELQPLAIADRNVVGFIVNPTNTDNIQVGEKLYGDMVETQDAVQFYLTGRLPKDVSPESKVIPGQLLVSDNDQRFIPGKLMTAGDGERFVPGQVVNTSHGEEFIPGQIVETSERPKFVPGQVVMTSRGEKFVPGQVIVEDEGPKFVPGQIIQTKTGATFIPGQMMNTDEGQLFVPGQLVETNAGPRFVPGQVAESPEGPKFIPGTIIETEEGLKYVPPDADEIDEDFEISFQGFEVSEEELALLMTNPIDARPHSPIVNEEGLIDSATLKKLAVDTVVVHGVTPEPTQPEKKKKKKKSRVQLDAVEEDEKMEVEEPDEGTDKVDVLRKFITASLSITEARREKEMKKLAKMLGDQEHESVTAVQVEAMTHILSTVNGIGDVVRVFLGDDEQLISDIVDHLGETNSMSKNDQAKRALRTAIHSVVTKRCDKEIDDIIHLLNDNPENLLTDARTQILLTEAVGIVCVTGNVEVAAMLEKFISEPSDPNALRENQDVVSVLRQLIVLHQIAERDPEVARMLQVLQTNPEGLKDRRKIRELLKNANMLLKKPKEETESDKKFDLRHVASSKDIPTEIFEQIKEDRKEADKFVAMLPDELFHEIMNDQRCGEALLESLDSEQAGRAKGDLHKFRKGMAIVVTKSDMQAVIPREFARSICYGIVPYLLIDEEGFKFFERGLTGRKLAPARVIENTWYMPDSYYAKKPSFERSVSGEQYSLVMLGRRRASAAQELLYTSLLPSSGPTRLSYLDGPNGEVDDLYRRSSKTSGMMWGDLDGGALTPRRMSSRALNDFGDFDSYTPRRGSQAYSDVDDMNTPSYLSRRSSRGITDLDVGGYVNRRPQQEEMDDLDSNYSALVPYNSVLTDNDTETTPICRSNTVAKLLDKYTNFSPKREFGYRSPDSAWSRHVGKRSSSKKGKERPVAEYDLASERALVPSSSRRRAQGKDDVLALTNSRERSRSKTPLSSGREITLFPLESSVLTGDDASRNISRRLDGSSLADPDSVLMNHENSSDLQSRPSRFTSLYGEDGEDPVISTPPSRRKTTSRTAKDPMEQETEPESNSLPGRRGFKERRARKAKGNYDKPDGSEEMNGRFDGPKERLGRTAQQNDDPYNWSLSLDPVKGRPQQHGGLRTSLVQDPYGQASQDPYGRATSEDFSRALGGSYGQLKDPYGREDPYGRKPPGPYGGGYQDSYGLSSQDPYGRSYGMSDGYGDRYLKGGYPSRLGYGEPESPVLGGYGPPRRPAYGMSQGYGPVPGYGYGAGGYSSYGGGYGMGGGYGNAYGGGYGGNYGMGGGGYGGSYGGGYGMGGGGYGVGGYGGGGGGVPPRGVGGGAYGNSPQGLEGSGPVGGGGVRLGGGGRLPSVTRTLPHIDEEENVPTDGLTPREAERLRIGKLASKYLRNPSPAPATLSGSSAPAGGRRNNSTTSSTSSTNNNKMVEDDDDE